MKPSTYFAWRRIFGLALLISLPVRGQSNNDGTAGDTPAAAPPPGPVGPVYDTSGVAGPHHRWQVITDENSTTTSRYLELATGLNTWDDATSSWLPSQIQMEVFEGGAISRHAAWQGVFSPGSDDPAGVFDLLMPLRPGDTQRERLRGQCVGIAMTDPQSGRSVWIAEAVNVAGLVGQDEVIYPDCLVGERGFSASLRYKLMLSGFAQDVVLQTDIETPTDLGFAPDAQIVIQVWTQFLDAPPATTSQELLPTGESDTRVDFGAMSLTRGTAFPLDLQAPNRVATFANSIPVTKEYVQMQGMQFLVESVPYSRIAPEAVKLRPLAVARKSASPRQLSGPLLASEGTEHARRLPVSRSGVDRFSDPSRSEGTPLVMRTMRPAGRALASAGYVLDFDLLSGSVTNLSLISDQTYYLSGAVHLYGTTTIEGSTVVKFKDNTASIAIDSAGSVVCLTEAYRPALFIGKDDDSAGEILTNSTHSVSGTYAYPAISYPSSVTASLSYLNIRDAKQGIYLNNGTSNNVVKHSQFVRCEQGVVGSGAGAKLRNVLFSDNTKALVGTSAGFSAENVTVRGSSYLLFDSGGSGVTATNSIFVNVTNLPSMTTWANCYTNNDASAVFIEVGAAKHYLTDFYRDRGTPNINATLAADLKLKTTVAPTVIMNTTLTTPTTFLPSVHRDTDMPDPGYHYDPIDWALSGDYATGAAITVQPGTVIATFANGALYHGLYIQTNSTITASGTAASPVRVVFYNCAQEQATTNWTRRTDNLQSFIISAGTGAFTFTDFYSLASLVETHITAFPNCPNPCVGTDTTTASHCRFIGAGILAWYTPFQATNCFFDSSFVNLYSAPNTKFLNCTFHRGIFDADKVTQYGVYYVTNCLFERTLIYQDTGGTSNYFAGYNAYEPGMNRISPTNANDVVMPSAMTYSSGHFGAYYQSVTNVVDRGLSTASSFGLYHFTSRSTDVKDGSTATDIGFHYVAWSGYDTDGDGIPDYVEDANGNGTLDSGETSPGSASDLGLKVLITEPKANAIIP